MSNKENWDAWYEFGKSDEDRESETMSDRMKYEQEMEDRKMLEGYDPNQKQPNRPLSKSEKKRELDTLRETRKYQYQQLAAKVDPEIARLGKIALALKLKKNKTKQEQEELKDMIALYNMLYEKMKNERKVAYTFFERFSWDISGFFLLILIQIWKLILKLLEHVLYALAGGAILFPIYWLLLKLFS